MRTNRVVVLSPGLDEDLCLVQIIEDFPRQKFVTELGVEALAVAVFPWTCWRYVEGLHADTAEPVS